MAWHMVCQTFFHPIIFSLLLPISLDNNLSLFLSEVAPINTVLLLLHSSNFFSVCGVNWVRSSLLEKQGTCKSLGSPTLCTCSPSPTWLLSQTILCPFPRYCSTTTTLHFFFLSVSFSTLQSEFLFEKQS